MITGPLELKKHLRQLPRRFDFVALLDVFFIALFFLMLSPRFILSPGLSIELPESSANIPMAGLPASAVITVRSDDMILFEGMILSTDDLGRELERYLENRPDPTVLVYFDNRIAIQTLVLVSDSLRQAGVKRIQVATESGVEDVEPLFQ